MSKFILSGPEIFTNSDSCPLLKSGAVLIDDCHILEVGEAHDIKSSNPDAIEEDLGEGLLTPGLVNLHHHLYSSLARGWNPKGTPPENFLQVLSNFWWKFDKSLELDDIYYSAMVGLCESVRMGVTSVIDHHSSQGNVLGSLDSIAEAFKKVGLKGSLCFELTDRGGNEIFESGLKETTDALRKWPGSLNNNNLTAMIGLHASLTLSEESLKRVSEIADNFNAGYHFHLAEDKSDQEDALTKYNMRVTRRFAKHGMLGPRSLAIHGVHLNDKEVELLRDSDTNLVLCPRSNQNNAVSLPYWWRYDGINLGLGTDGIGSDIIDEAKSALYISHHVSENPGYGFDNIRNILFNNNPEIFFRITGLRAGRIEPGFPADLVLWRYYPPTPLTDENIWGHYLYGLYNHAADSVWIDGNKILENGEFTKFDYRQLVSKTRLLAKMLWERI